MRMKGWGKVKEAAAYAGVSERTVEEWLKKGLRCSRLPTGLRLIKYQWIDEFLEKYADSANRVDQIVDDVVRALKIS
jgi:excisionase family DNA binding protein